MLFFRSCNELYISYNLWLLNIIFTYNIYRNDRTSKQPPNENIVNFGQSRGIWGRGISKFSSTMVKFSNNNEFLSSVPLTLRFRHCIKDVNCTFRSKILHFFALTGGTKKFKKSLYIKITPYLDKFLVFFPPQNSDV